MFLQVLIALVLPPVAVLSEVGMTKHFWINLLCACFFWVPAIIHAIWIVTRPEMMERRLNNPNNPDG